MWKEDKENAINGKQKDSVQEDTIVASATMGKTWKTNTNVRALFRSSSGKDVEKFEKNES